MVISTFCLLGVIALLALTTALMQRQRNEELYLRIRSWIPILAIVLVANGFGTWGWTCLFGAIAVIGMWELQRAYRNSHEPIRLKYYALNLGGWLLLAMGCLSAIAVTTAAPTRSYLLLYVLLVAQSNDVLQYIWGKALGKRPLAPHISPKKTWEGACCGSLSAALLATAIGYPIFDHLALPLLFLQGWGLAGIGIIGDLMVSQFKRQAGIKDMGRLIPGHGGILDRVDSLLLSAPIYYLSLYLMA